ncbi:ICE2-domain-containing protein, partial [Rhodotorula sp. JG-1b]
AAQLVSILQVLLFLPLTLDIAGPDCMLALSLLLTLSPVSTLVAWLQPLVIPALLLLTLNLYSATGEAPHPHPAPAWLTYALAAAPSYWERLLRTSSPVFVILEGLCTLLCIQALSRFSLGRIQASKTPDLFRMGSLILAAGVYVASAYFLWESYGAVPDRISSTLIGVAVTTILFLSGISFSIQKGNVIESSLMLAYAVFQIFHLSSRPQMYTGGLLSHVFRATGTNGHPPLPPVVLQSCVSLSLSVSQTFGAGVEFVMAASSALPFSVLVTLFYRVAVLYAATRIVLNLKRQTTGSWNDDDRKLSDEEPVQGIPDSTHSRSRSLVLAVYTHLLVLSSSNDQVFWRWGNVFLVQLLWAIEIRLGQHLDDDET